MQGPLKCFKNIIFGKIYRLLIVNKLLHSDFGVKDEKSYKTAE